jgi:hypothetical protein
MSRKTSHATLEENQNLSDDGAAPAAAKKAKVTTRSDAAAKSPYEVQRQEFSSVVKRLDALGAMCVRDLDMGKDPDAEEEDEDEEEELNKEEYDAKCKTLTQKQVDAWRCIIVTKELDKGMEDMGKLVLGDQYGGSFMMFDTSFSYQVLGAFDIFNKKYMRPIGAAKQFPLLFGFTNTISENDVWMHDHESEWGGERMIKSLGRKWMVLMSKTPKQLGIDSEFTLPAVKAFLKDFKEKVESIDTCDDPAMAFNYE